MKNVALMPNDASKSRSPAVYLTSESFSKCAAVLITHDIVTGTKRITHVYGPSSNVKAIVPRMLHE